MTDRRERAPIRVLTVSVAGVFGWLRISWKVTVRTVGELSVEPAGEDRVAEVLL